MSKDPEEIKSFLNRELGNYYIASVSRDKTIKIIDPIGEFIVGEIKDHKEQITSLIQFEDMIISSSIDGYVKKYDIKTLTKLGEIQISSDFVTFLIKFNDKIVGGGDYFMEIL